VSASLPDPSASYIGFYYIVVAGLSNILVDITLSGRLAYSQLSDYKQSHIDLAKTEEAGYFAALTKSRPLLRMTPFMRPVLL
jgi:hypothetical protein